MSQVYRNVCNAQMYGGEICCYREYAYYYIYSVKYLKPIYTHDDFTNLIESRLDDYQYFATFTLQEDFSMFESEELE